MQDEQRRRRDRLVTTHAPVVHELVREVMARVPASVDPDVLTAAGLAALDEAADTFDADRGVPFAAYVRTQVRTALVAQLRSHDWASPATRPVDGARLDLVADAVAALPERLRLVVRGYFLEQRPLADLAAELGMSEDRVSLLRAEALVLLRAAFGHAFEDAAGPARVGAQQAAYLAAVGARSALRPAAVAPRAAGGASA